MASKQFPIYMVQEAWDYIDELKKSDPVKGRGAFIAEIVLADKERKERAEKRKAAESVNSNPAA